MSRSHPLRSGLLGGIAFAGVLGGAWWIVHAKAPQPTAAPHAAPTSGKKIGEDELGIVTLTPEAEERLGVETAAAERRAVPRLRVYGGEVTVPAGRTVLVAAPLAGTLEAPAGGVPQAGSQVSKGQHVISLLPLLSPEASTTFAASRADAAGQVKNAETQLAAMKLALERARRLYRDEAGSKRGVEEAQAQHDVALRSLEAAESRLTILERAVGDAATGRASPIPIEAPETGILRNLSAHPGQNVPAGGALFEVVDLAEVWVRVPVYVGDLPDLALSAGAEVGNLNMRSGDRTWSASPVQAPPSANPLASTVDVFVSLRNEQAQLTPGQRVGVTLRLGGGGEDLTVPWSAVVFDVQGGSWVYVVAGERKYRRERVLLRYVVDALAVLAAGPAPGTQVVSAGAIELFGAETGFSK